MAGGVGLPDDGGGGGAVDEAEVAVSKELEGGRGIRGAAAGVGGACDPDGDAVVGYGGEEGGTAAGGDEAEREGGVWGIPSLVRV